MKRIICLALCAILSISTCFTAYAQDTNTTTLAFKTETQYGTVYYVKHTNATTSNGQVGICTLWDVTDIIMAGLTWADFLKMPTWAGFGWCVLDTAALLPVLPSTAYVRKGSQVVLNSSEMAKFAKTDKGAKAIKGAMKAYKYSDGISSKAIKDIEKHWKGTQGKEAVKKFKDAADKGIVAPKNSEGIKKLAAPDKNIGKQYTHEIKVLKSPYSDYRVFGYRTEAGEWVFDKFGVGLGHK